MDMLTVPPKRGYKINYVYYSTEEGTITKVKLSELHNKGDFHYSAYYKFRNRLKCP
jgi:hypothetical protein